MKRVLSKQEAHATINSFFEKVHFNAVELKKIRRLAMKYKIPLREKRRKFCKYCLNKLEGKTRITKTHKTIVCKHCGKSSRFLLKH